MSIISTSKEINIACAKALGLEIIHDAWPVGVPPDGGMREAALDEGDTSYWWRERAPIYKKIDPHAEWGEEERAQLGLWCEPVPLYSSDHDAARSLEDEIARRGIGERYVEALYPLVRAWQFGMSTAEQWLLIRATPEQRARAFLKVVSE